MKYKRMVRHKYKPRKETKSFSKNTEHKIFTTKKGNYLAQSHLSGKYTYYDKKGKVIKPKKR